MYRLSHDELLYCIRVGTQRQTTNVKNNIKSKQFTKRDPTNIHIQGVLGELAFAQFANNELKANLDVFGTLNRTESRGANTDTFDWIMNNKKIDVKTTLSPYAKNVYARYFKRSNPADYYILMFLAFYEKDLMKQIVPTQKQYDELLFKIQMNPEKYVVEGEFRGFVPCESMFAMAAMQDGSHCAAVDSSIDNFISVLLPVCDKSKNVLESK